MKMTGRATPWSARGMNACVVFVVFTFACIYCTAAFGVVLPELELTVPGVTHMSVLSTLTGLALLSYWFCVFLDAGPVPPHWLPDTECPSQVLEVKRKGAGSRYCQKCSSYKPPRAHHCRVCNRCVLRMDHHCMWINNCVGHRNYKAFVLFLIYACIALIHANLILSGLVSHFHSLALDPAAQHIQALQPPPPPAEAQVAFALWRVLTLSASTVLLTLLAMLLAWHVYLIVQNKTTIEYHEGVRARTTGHVHADKHYAHPYNLGLYSNIGAVLGLFPGNWLLPLHAGLAGDGLTYPVADTTLAKLHGAVGCTPRGRMCDACPALTRLWRLLRTKNRTV